IRVLFLLLRPTSSVFPYTTLFRSTPVPSLAGFKRTSAPAKRTLTSWGIVVPTSGTAIRFFLASSTPLRIASATSLALPLPAPTRSEEHTSELQSRENLVCRLLLEK